MHPRWVIAQKEITGVFKERTILLAVAIQVIVAGFSGFLVIGLSALVDPASFPAGGQAVILVDDDAARDASLMRHLRAENIEPYQPGAPASPSAPSDDEIWSAFQRGEGHGAIFLRKGATPADPVDITLVLPDGDIRTTLTLTQVKNALEGYERELREARAERLSFEPVYVDNDAKAGSYSFVYTLLIPLLVFLPVVLAGALCADSITEEVQRKTLPILLSSPATPADVVEGKLLANCAVAPILAAAWFGLLALNGLPVAPMGAIGILVLAASLTYLLGLLACAIALATRDRNKAHVTYAAAMFLLIGLSLALPVSPVNAIALLAAGSAHAGVWMLVVAFAACALIGSVSMRVSLRRAAQWMAAGSA